MSCPTRMDLDLLAMDALDPSRAGELLPHLRVCERCRAHYEGARRDHVQRIRMYEAFDQQHDELREQLMAALPANGPARSSADPLIRGWRRLGDCFMLINKSTPRRIAAVLLPAACILVAVLLLTHPSAQKSAFAAAIERFQQAHTIACRLVMPEGLEFQGLRFAAEGELYLSDEHGSYSTVSVNGMEVTRSYAPLEGPVIAVQPVTKTYLKLDVSELAATDMQQQTPAAFLEALRKLTDTSATELTPRTVADRPALGYHIPGEKLGFPSPACSDAPATYAELWIDRQTQLPLQFLLSVPVPGQEKPLTIIYDQFQWDIPLQPDLFDPKIPENYTEIDARLARPSEAALLNALSRVAEWTGQYPSDLSPVAMLTQLHTQVPQEKRSEFEQLGEAGIVRLAIEIAGGAMFYMELIRDNRDPEYFGEQIRPTDSDKVLLRWKLDDGRTRVIYGDLSAETLD